MTKRRFIVKNEFNAWRPGNRDYPESYLPMRVGFDLFAETETMDEYVIFDMDAREFEADGATFLQSTKRYLIDKPEDVGRGRAVENTDVDTPNLGSDRKEAGVTNDRSGARIPKAFVSHSTQDHAFVERFATDLRANGVDAWYSAWEIKPGDSIRAKIEEGLEGCEYFIVVLSKNSINRPWVKTELDSATVRKIGGKVRKIIPVKIEDCGELPPTLGSLCWEDFSSQSYHAALRRVLHSIFDIDSRPRLGSPPTVSSSDLVKFQITALSAEPEPIPELPKRASRSVEFPIHMNVLGAFVSDLLKEGFDARSDLFNGQIGLIVGPKGLDPRRMNAGEGGLFFPLWELNHEGNRALVVARGFHDIVTDRPLGWKFNSPYQRSVDRVPMMTKRRAVYGGFVIVVAFNGRVWTYDIRDPDRPELFATADIYKAIEEAQQQAVKAAQKLCAMDNRALPKDPVKWVDSE